MSKERLSEFAQKNSELSQKMTEAWSDMVKEMMESSGRFTIPEGAERKKNWKGKKHFTEYQRALKGWLKLTSKNLS